MSQAKESAFPFVEDNGNANFGLTKLEYFAGLAMQGLLANPKIGDASDEFIGEAAVNQAYSLLKALADDELMHQH